MNDYMILQQVQDIGNRRRIVIIIAIGISILTIISFRGHWTTISEKFQKHILMNADDNFGMNFLKNSKNIDRFCQWYFLNYTPSSWENYWMTNIDQLQHTVCETLANQDNLNKSALAVERLKELQKFGRNRTESDKQSSDALLSKMFYRQECINPLTNVSYNVADVSQLIEPLIGLLRDPLTMCARVQSLPDSAYEGAEIQSKRFFLLSIAAPYYIHSLAQISANIFKMSTQSDNLKMNLLPWMFQRSKLNLPHTKLYTKNSQNILIDLGSSYFGSWQGDSSAAAGRWFYENYKRFDTRFDRIIAYEHASLDPKIAWSQLPDDVFPVYTLINVGCAIEGKFSPWTTLKRIAKPQDHVVIKLDIDTPAIEGRLIHEILNDSSVSSLIDEVFFEHHITVKEMTPSWGNPPGTLKDSYILFTKLRQLGIRMHSWP